jgi:hypothetical protein
VSQAVIDFCDSLKTTLLDIEERLVKAKTSLEAGTAAVKTEAGEQIDEAAALLSAFRARAADMAEQVRADLPGRAEQAGDALKHFGEEAQVALRHAVVFLADAASKSAESAANALHAGSHRAGALAQKLRHETAVAKTAETPPS